MENGEKTTSQEEHPESELLTKETRSKVSTKRKFVSQNQFDDLRSTVIGMQSEMSKLVSILQDSLIPAKRMRSMPPETTSGQPEGLENQFLLHTSEPHLSMPAPENQFLERPIGNQFATNNPGDQFPVLQNSADLLNEDVLSHPSPLSLSAETSEGHFIPNFDNGIATLPFTTVPTTEQQSVKLHFVEDKVIGSPISEPYAKHIEDCCRKRILSSELTKFKESFKRPQNWPALSVPTINPTLWAQLPKDSKEHDKRLQNAQSLLAKGLTGVVQMKDTLLQIGSRTDQFSLLQQLSEQVDACVALLGLFGILLPPKRSLEAGYQPTFSFVMWVKNPSNNVFVWGRVQKNAQPSSDCQIFIINLPLSCIKASQSFFNSALGMSRKLLL